MQGNSSNIVDFESQNMSWYKALYQDTQSILLLIHPETGEIVNANASASRFYGWTVDELCSMKISAINCLSAEEIFNEMQKAKTQKRNYFLFKHRLASGVIRDVEVYSGPVVVSGQTLLYSLVHDISERLKAELDLKISEERWKYALEGATDGVWDWSVPTNKVFYSTQWKAMLGFEENEIGDSLDEWSKRVHPDDYDYTIRIVQDHLEGKTDFYSCEHRVVCKDGSYKWILDEGKVVQRDAFGKPLRAIGTHKDISKRKSQEIQLAKLDRLHKMLSDVNDAIVRAVSMHELFQKICQIGIEEGKFLLTWIGKANFECNNVEVLHAEGIAKDYTTSLIIPLSRKGVKKGPSALVVSKGKTIISSDINNDPEMKPWRENALAFGLKSVIALPLRSSKEIFGTLNLYSGEIDFFENDEILLLEKIAETTSYAIESFQQNELRIQSETSLRENELKMRLMFDSMAQGVIIQDNKGGIISANPAAIKILGLNIEQLTHSSINNLNWAAIHEDGSPFKIETYPVFQAFKTGKAINNVIVGLQNPPKANTRWLNLSSIPLFLENQQYAVQVYSIFEDITEQKKAFDQLNESNKRFRILFNHSPINIVVSDEQGVIIDVNKEFEKTTLLNKQEVIGQHIKILTGHRDQRKINENIKKILQGEVLEQEVKNKLSDGSIKYFFLKESKIILPDGKVGILSSSIDITNLKRAEENIFRLNMHYKALIEKAPDGIALLDKNRKITLVNPYANSMFGFMLSNKTEINPREYTHPDDLSLALETLAYIYQNPNKTKTIQIRISDSNHNWKWLETTFTNMLNNPNIEAVIINFRDITVKKLAQISLYETEERYSKAFQTSPYSVIITHPKTGKFIEFNQAFIEMSGYTSEEIKNNNTIGLDLWLHPKEREKAVADLKSGIEVSFREYQFKRKGGEVLIGMFSAQIIQLKGEPYIMSSINNITAQKQAIEMLNESKEQLKLYASHLQNIREEERISLAREIHDDLGQTLVAIKFDIGILNKKVSNFNDLSYSDILKENIVSLQSLIEKANATSRKVMIGLRLEENENFELISALENYIHEYQKRYRIKCILETNITELKMNANKSIALFRLFQEALSNTHKYANGSIVEINIYKQPTQYFFQISDNGIGFDMSQKKKTTSFGLLGMKERVVLLGGSIDIKSAPGKGTQITVMVPINK